MAQGTPCPPLRIAVHCRQRLCLGGHWERPQSQGIWSVPEVCRLFIHEVYKFEILQRNWKPRAAWPGNAPSLGSGPPPAVASLQGLLEIFLRQEGQVCAVPHTVTSAAGLKLDWTALSIAQGYARCAGC